MSNQQGVCCECQEQHDVAAKRHELLFLDDIVDDELNGPEMRFVMAQHQPTGGHWCLGAGDEPLTLIKNN